MTAILTVLLCGVSGEAYNAGNPETYCSIIEMAQLVAEQIAKDKIKVQFPQNKAEEKFKYPPSHHLHLDVSKLENLAWKPTKNLKEMYLRMLVGMKKLSIDK